MTTPLKIAVAINVSRKPLNLRLLQISTFLLLIVFICQEISAAVYIAPQLRCRNYPSYSNQGSCVHASTITTLRYHKAYNLANYIPRYYSGGNTHYELNQRLNRWGLTTKATFSSSKGILDFAHTNTLPAIISYHNNHSCLFLGWYVDPKTRIITHAYVLNPNHPNHIETPQYQEFMNNWRRNDGEAVVIVPRR